jgi:N-6 DNA Methylase
MASDIKDQARALAATILLVTDRAQNEQQLRHEVENALKDACSELGITWTSFHLERRLRGRAGRQIRFADAIHGAVVIEYESPRSFNGREGRRLAHAKQQAEEYTTLLQEEEGRPHNEYVLIAWDGAHVDFGRWSGTSYVWDGLHSFGVAPAKRILNHLRDDGIPLVHPLLLSNRVGPSSPIGTDLLPSFFAAVQNAKTGIGSDRTKLLFTEWRRLFAQVVGDPSERIKTHLAEIGEAHKQDYASDPAGYLFALNTYIALVAKLVAALALPQVSEDVSDPTIPIGNRMRQLESGRLFLDAGITNMLNGDFFSWYLDDTSWPSLSDSLYELVDTLRAISFDVTRKEPQATRDLFKGLYMTFAPPALRHSLGEYYTPDWLAGHAFNVIDWKPDQSVLDPTCGSGTFLLEALRRRMVADTNSSASAAELLSGLHGFDLNPLAVLAARASLVVFVGNRLDPANPLQVPIYLADAVNPAHEDRGLYTHSLQTERGIKTFCMPAEIVKSPQYFQLMQGVRDLIDDGQSRPEIVDVLSGEPLVRDLADDQSQAFWASIDSLRDLHDGGWDGIWCSILADRFAAGAIEPVNAVVGNPPWVRWSHLPPEYAEFIKPLCVQLDIFSTDSWVGGIESDISTVITYRALGKYCDAGGVLAFFITGTVFANESSQGFRRWQLHSTDDEGVRTVEPIRVERVEDFAALRPFEGVNNHPTLLVLRRDSTETRYPVPYTIWHPRKRHHQQSGFSGEIDFEACASHADLTAQPVPGSDAGPWLKGTASQQRAWLELFDGAGTKSFRARKGVTTDANGIYFVRTEATKAHDVVKIRNSPSLGRRVVPEVSARIEATHLFPLLRGSGISAFEALPDRDHCVIVPQRGMHGDETLPRSAPKTFRFLRRFEATLLERSSYRLYQKKDKFWTLWSTGPYTFAPFKVVWQEMPGKNFCAAYIGSYEHPVLGTKVVVPDHKVYFVPCESEEEAAFLSGFLNGPSIAAGVNAYAAALSLGVSVVEYLRIPMYEAENPSHAKLVAISKRLTESPEVPNEEQLDELERRVTAVRESASEDADGT